MKSLLCLSNGSPAPMRVRICSMSLSSTWSSGLQFSLKNASLSLTASRPLGHNFHPVICSSSRNDRQNRIARGAVGASIVLACALGIASFGLRMCPKANAGPKELSQKAPQVKVYPLGGMAALNSLLDVTLLLTSGELGKPDEGFRLPSVLPMEETKTIKMQAVRLMKYKKADVAVNFLEQAYNKYKNEPEPAYNVEMVLVEILLCKGEYEKALDRNCLKSHQSWPSDARIPLYKAIIYTMLENKEEAKKWWGEYTRAIDIVFNPINV